MKDTHMPRSRLAPLRIALSSMGMLFCLAATGCGDDSNTRECSASSECVQGGVHGTCRPSTASDKSWCSYQDLACPMPTSERWGAAAGDGLAGTCVEGGADAGPDAAPAVLSVGRTGSGGGRLVSDPAGIDCGMTCEATFAPGASVTLTATPEGTATFVEWSGDCTGTGTCSLTMDASKSVTAKFAASAEKIWLRQIVGSEAAATDSSGNVIIAGSLTGMVDFGAGITKNTAGSVDAYVAKLSASNGATLWATAFGGVGIDVVEDVAVDAAGNAVAVGYFGSGSMTVGGMTLTSTGGEDFFVVKLSGTDGSVMWAKTFGGAGNQRAHGVAIGESNNIMVVGQFAGGLVMGTTTVTSAGGIDAFVARISTGAGTPLWVKGYGGSDNDLAQAVAVRNSAVVVTGSYKGNSVSFGGTALPAHVESAIFLAKYKEVDGGHFWSFGYGGTPASVGNAVAIHSDDSIALAATISGTVNFGGTDLTGIQDVAVAKFTTAGTHVWSKAFGGSTFDAPHDIAIDAAGDFVVGGYFRESINFGGGALPAAGTDQDIFVAKLSGAAGAHLWSRRYGGAAHDDATGVNVVTGGAVVISGSFGGIAEFGEDALTNTDLSTSGYVLKLAP
jgi:hypothetical protein